MWYLIREIAIINAGMTVIVFMLLWIRHLTEDRYLSAKPRMYLIERR